MSNQETDVQRRIAGMAATAQCGMGDAHPAVAGPAPTGKAGDFDFLSGNWKIAHRRLKEGAWDSVDGEATVHAILGGVGSVEELRIPSRGFAGLGLRLLDVERKLWADHWVNATSGVLDGAPTWGSFESGSGRWDSSAAGIITRGVWDQITPRSCRWFQATSTDGGKTWAENWIMHWQRA